MTTPSEARRICRRCRMSAGLMSDFKDPAAPLPPGDHQISSGAWCAGEDASRPIRIVQLAPAGNSFVGLGEDGLLYEPGSDGNLLPVWVRLRENGAVFPAGPPLPEVAE